MSSRYSGPNQPPDYGEPRTDPWGWLYREDGPGEPARSAPVQRDPADQDAESGQDLEQHRPQLEETQPHRPSFASGWAGQPAPHHPGSGPSGLPVAGPSGLSGPSGPSGPPRRRRRGLLIGLIVGALVLAVALAVVLLVLPGWADRADRADRTDRADRADRAPASSSTASGDPSGRPYDGAVTRLAPTEITAECVAPAAIDANGDPVSYAPANVADDDPSSAWRCDGDGTGESIRVNLPDGSQVAQVGLVNGYAKVDPGDGSRRYPEYRRVSAVRWTLSNGTAVEQTLTDNTESVQTLALPVQEGVDWAEVTILDATAPGSQQATRDAVLISAIQVSAPG